jgi:hypothetical protein
MLAHAFTHVEQMVPELLRLIDELDRVKRVRMKAWLAKLQEAVSLS